MNTFYASPITWYPFCIIEVTIKGIYRFLSICIIHFIIIAIFKKT